MSKNCDKRFLSLILPSLCLLFVVLTGQPAYTAPISVPFVSANVLILGEKEDGWAGANAMSLGNLNGLAGPELLIGEPSSALQGTAYLINDLLLDQASFPLNESHVSFNGTISPEPYGKFLAGLGDIDGDGINDFLIGSQKNNSLYIFLGKGHSSGAWTQPIPHQGFIQTDSIPESPGVKRASYLSIQGDVNGDGFDDILIGASQSDIPSHEKAGKTYLIFGRSAMESFQEDSFTSGPPTINVAFLGESASDHSGYSVAILPDINGDGYDDILISAYHSTSPPQKTYLIYGQSNGFSDIIINSEGEIPLSRADAIFHNTDEGTHFGEKVASIGDINGDGYGDFAIGAYQDSSKGAAYIYYGGLGTPFSGNYSTSGAGSSAKLTGNDSSDFSRHSISRAGDINGDLIDDFIIGEFKNSISETDEGKAFLILGQSTKLTGTLSVNTQASHEIIGAQQNERVGFTVGSAGDLNQDGIDEVLVGAYQHDNKGAVGIFSFATLVPPNLQTGDTLALYKDPSFTTLSSENLPHNRDWVYIQLDTTDSNPSSVDIVEVIASSNMFPKETTTRLLESAPNTGIFRGKLQLVRSRTSRLLPQVAVTLNGILTVRAKDKPSITASTQVTNAAPIISNLTLTQVGTSNATTVSINFTITDYDNDEVSISVKYSSDNGNSFNVASLSDASVIDTISVSEFGTSHHLFWEAPTDIGFDTDGNYLIQIIANDTVLDSLPATTSIPIDNLKPNAPIISQPAPKNAFLITVTGNAEALSVAHILVNGIEKATGNVTADGTFSLKDIPVSSTEKTLTAYVVDKWGFSSDISSSVEVPFSILTHTLSHNGLSMDITIPIDGILSDTEILMTRKSTEDLTTLQPAPQYYNFFDGFDLSVPGADENPLKDIATITVHFPQPLTILTSFTIKYHDEIQDIWSNRGITINQVTSQNVSFSTSHFTSFALLEFKDDTVPTIHTLYVDEAPISTDAYYSATPSFSVLVEDDKTGIATWSIQISDVITERVVAQTSSFNAGVILNQTLSFKPSTPLDSGRYQVLIRAIDHNANESTRTATFQVDTTDFHFSALHAPNPFNPSKQALTLSYNLSLDADEVHIYIFNLRRDLIWHFHGSPSQTVAGYHSTSWDGKRSFGEIVPNGLYYAYCLAKRGSTTKKIKLKVVALR